MRAVLGIGGLLATFGVVAWLLYSIVLPSAQTDLNAEKKADAEIQQISGRTETGKKVEDTFQLFADTDVDGKLLDFQVTHLDPDSPMKTYFGLQVNDVILEAQDSHGVLTPMRGSNDDEASRLAIRDAYAGGGKLIVQRGSSKLTLPANNP